MFKRLATVGSILLLAVPVAGCGGASSGAHYSRPALVACLHQRGVPTRDISHPVTAFDKQVATFLKPIDPNFVGAKFQSDEFVGIAFAADSAGASNVRGELQKLAKSPGATPGKITQKGSIVVLTRPHVTAGVQKTLDQCESNAATT